MPERLPELLARHEAAAVEALDPGALDYIAGGGSEELSVAEAIAAWRSFRLRPHVLRDVSRVETSTSLLGTPLTQPLLVAPTAFHVIAHADAEVETARGVAAAGGFMVVATRANALLEDIAAALSGPWWLQVYALKDRGITEGVVRRGVQAGASALMLTGDTPILSRRRDAASLPPLSRRQYLGNMAPHVRPDARVEVETAQDPSITLETVAWLREISGLPVIVKGVLRDDDARACVDAGAAGVVVSNHGGRQLDRTLAPAYALRDVVNAVGDRAIVLVDGGVRSGIDVLIALALGAHAVMLGRPVSWALACDGAAGVQTLLDAFREDLREAMALAGVDRVSAIDASLVRPPA